MKLNLNSLLSISLGIVTLGIAAPLEVSAMTLTWDSDISQYEAQDGLGIWDAYSMHWFDPMSGNVVWDSSGLWTAAFGVQASDTKVVHSVALTEQMAVNRLQFNNINLGEYHFSGGGVLNLMEVQGEEGFENPVITLHNRYTNFAVTVGGYMGFTLESDHAANRLAFTGGFANTYEGTTYIKGGEIFMNKTGNAQAINGDVIIDGGTLRWEAANQLADTASVTLNSGILYLGAKTETFKNLTINGGNSNGGTASNMGVLTLTGTFTLGARGSIGLNSNAQWSANRVVFEAPVGSTTTQAYTVTGNGNTISTLTVGSGGLEVYNRSLMLNTGSSTTAKGSQILLRGNVTTSGGAVFAKNGSYHGVGQINLESAVREWNVQDNITNVQIGIVGDANAGLTKKGNGVLMFTSNATSEDEANTYGGMTTIEAGTIKMFKSAGINSISGDVTVKTGAVLDWDRGHQMADTSSIHLEGGTLRLESFEETLANIYQSAGAINHNNDTANGRLTVTGTIRISGGSQMVLNSGAEYSAGRFEATSSMRGTTLMLNGNSTSVLNSFHVGEGGMSLTGQNVTLSKALTAAGRGSELSLAGDFSGSGNNTFHTSGGAHGVAQLNLHGAERVFNISSGNTTLNVNVVSTAGTSALTKRGAGILTLGRDNSYRGNTRVEAGTLRLSTDGTIANSPRITVLSNATLDVGSVAQGYRVLSGQTLEGGGSILGNTTLASGSTLSVGTQGVDATQHLNLDANLTLESGSQLQMDLGSDGDHDKLIITGSLTQLDGSKITVLANGVTSQEGDSYQLFEVAGDMSFSSLMGNLYRSGAEDNNWGFDLPDLSALGLLWDLSQLSSMGRISVVPEPSRACLVLLSLTLIGLRRKRNP